MPMTVTIENKTKRMKVYNLAHETLRGFGREFGYKRLVAFEVAHNRNTGEQARTKIRKSVPNSLTLTSGEVREELPPEILRVKEIAADRRAGKLLVSYQESLKTSDRKTLSASGVPDVPPKRDIKKIVDQKIVAETDRKPKSLVAPEVDITPPDEEPPRVAKKDKSKSRLAVSGKGTE